MTRDSLEIAKVLGYQVRRLRRAKDVAQVDLAERAGISQTFLSAIERGVKFPSGETIEALAHALDVQYEALFQNPEPVTTLRIPIEVDLPREARPEVKMFASRVKSLTYDPIKNVPAKGEAKDTLLGDQPPPSEEL